MDDAYQPNLKAFDERLAMVHLRGQWTVEANLQKSIDGPTPRGVPYVWRYDEVLGYLEEACREFPEALHARRNLTFDNPELDRYTTHTLAAGIQLIQPGEVAWPHRHTATALRFVIDGDPNLVTVVDGIEQPMENYDLILTQNWSWHGHHNRAEKDVTWLDLLDVPLIHALNQAFFEPGEMGRMVPPVNEAAKPARTMRFRWADIETRLRTQAASGEADPYDGCSVPYSDPETGGPTLPTVNCRAHMLRPGEETARHRHTASAIYFVIRGTGKTVVGDTELAWSRHDTFCIPNWSWHHHVNRDTHEDAMLFSIDDSPLLAAFGLNREQVTGD